MWSILRRIRFIRRGGYIKRWPRIVHTDTRWLELCYSEYTYNLLQTTSKNQLNGANILIEGTNISSRPREILDVLYTEDRQTIFFFSSSNRETHSYCIYDGTKTLNFVIIIWVHDDMMAIKNYWSMNFTKDRAVYGWNEENKKIRYNYNEEKKK